MTNGDGSHEPDDWRVEMTAALAELRDRVSAVELEHLQVRTKYLQTQVRLLRYERGWDPAWSELEDADVEVLNEQIDALRVRIEAHASPGVARAEGVSSGPQIAQRPLAPCRRRRA